MTNNPTIDGVSRQLLERIVKDQCVSVAIVEQLRALLDAPAVERQEPDRNSWRLNSEIRCPQCVGHGTYLDGEQCGTCSGSGLKSGTALQSTIAQLQARVQELESGRGEPVAWRFRVTTGGEWFVTTKERVAELYSGTEDGGEVERLYTSPPAPVAVVLPERMEDPWNGNRDYPTYESGWNDCLDKIKEMNQ